MQRTTALLLPWFLVAALARPAAPQEPPVPPTDPAPAAVPAADPAITLTPGTAAPGEDGQLRFTAAADAQVPAGIVVRCALTAEGQTLGVVSVIKPAEDGPLPVALGPFPTLLPGLYRLTPSVLAEDQDPALYAAHPELARLRCRPCDLRVGTPQDEKDRRFFFHRAYVETTLAFREIWMGLWHRAEWMSASLRTLKFSKPPRLPAAKRDAAAAEWREYVEGRFAVRLAEREKTFTELVAPYPVVYEVEARDALLALLTVLKRARAVYWRQMAPLIELAAPADTEGEPNVPPASLARNAQDGFRILYKRFGAEVAGCDVLPPLPLRPDDVRQSGTANARTVAWTALGISLRPVEGWECDPIPGFYPTLAVLCPADRPAWEARLGYWLDPRVSSAADAAQRIAAAARPANGGAAPEIAALDPQLTSASGRPLLLSAWSEGAVRVLQLTEVDATNGRAIWLRLSGAEAGEEDLRRLVRALGWPNLAPPPAPDPKDPKAPQPDPKAGAKPPAGPGAGK